MALTPLERAKELIEGMYERRATRIAANDLGTPTGWQCEVNEIRRILEYLIEHAEVIEKS